MFRSTILFFATAIVLIGCSSSNTEKHGNDKLRIVVTTNIIQDVIQNLVGESAEVISLMGPGVDPHFYKASQGDVEKLLKADLIVYNGLHLEGKMTDVLDNISSRRKTVCLADGLKESEIRYIDDNNAVADPHFWFDMQKWKHGLDHFVKKTSDYFPSLADTLKSRSQSYFIQIDSMHQWVGQSLSNIPEGQRHLITSHDAFKYYGEAYHIHVRGLQGISTLTEAGLRDVTDMVKFIIENEIKAVFVESSVSQKSLRSVIEGCGERGHDIQLGGELYSDALGEPRTPEGSYIGMIRYNTQTITNALK